MYIFIPNFNIIPFSSINKKIIILSRQNEERTVKDELRDPPAETSSSNDLELLKSKLSDAINSEKEMKRKLVEAAKKMKTMKDEITSLRSQSSNPTPQLDLGQAKFYLSELSSLRGQASSLKNEVKSFQNSLLSSIHSSALSLINREREYSNSILLELKAKLSSEMRERKKLFNLLQELKGKTLYCISVYMKYL